MKASEYREHVGDLAPLRDPIARATYETLKRWEAHHANEHKECEDEMARTVKIATAAAMAFPMVGLEKER